MPLLTTELAIEIEEAMSRERPCESVLECAEVAAWWQILDCCVRAICGQCHREGLLRAAAFGNRRPCPLHGVDTAARWEPIR